MRRERVLAAAVLIVAVGPGCVQRNCVPPHLANTRHLIDLSADPEGHAPVPATLTREVEAEFRKRTAGAHPPGAQPYHLLAISGGGLYGSFGVGVLNGWTASGTRPQFDVVTGISTGAILASFAFLGPEYDSVIREEAVGVDIRDILRRRSVVHLPFSESAFDSAPLDARIDKYVTPELLCEVAKAHAQGRRLYIGTTNIDTRRLIIWDMGAIASRGTPESLKLYHDVILASSSIPGAMPPVRIPVEIDGAVYEELHVDGGVSDEVVFRAFMVADLNRRRGIDSAFAPPGSALYIISNGKLYADPDCVEPRIARMIGASFRTVIYGKTRDELYRIYLNCLETGVEFRVAAIPQDVRLGEQGSLQLSRKDQERLFAEGFRTGSEPIVGRGWRDMPPGTNPAEQALPRSGTRFATPPGGLPMP